MVPALKDIFYRGKSVDLAFFIEQDKVATR